MYFSSLKNTTATYDTEDARQKTAATISRVSFQRLPNKQKKIILEELSRQHLHSLLDLHRNYAIDDAEEGVHDSYEEEKEREEERKRREEFYKK